MEKQKIYIFIMHIIRSVGGAQMYVIGKSRYLKKLGWDVHTFCYSDKKNASFPSLDDCMTVTDGFGFLSTPPYRLKRDEQDFFLNLMIQKLKIKLENLNEYEVIIETITAPPHYWGELLAYKLGARHFADLLEEYFRFANSYHVENLDFFYFKLKRNELLIANDQLKKLFQGYKDTDKAKVLNEITDTVMEQYPIQDVECSKIDEIEKLDWNICHFGRCEKVYVPYFIEAVAELAKKYPDKKINFIFLGDVESRLEMINQTFKNISNVKLTFLGVLVPIPRILFSKVDVVCAISQSAIFSANEGVLTITGSAVEPKKTPGVLGYDILKFKDALFGDISLTYLDALENVLVKLLYDNKEYKLPKILSEEHYYDKFWKIVENADPKKEYYFDRLSQDRIRHWAAVFPFGQIARGTKVIFVGATEIATDYRRQVQTQQPNNPMNFINAYSQIANQYNYQVEIGPDGIKKISDEPYCEILATVDEHPEDFDDTVQGFDRLKQLDYDAILITTYSWQTKDAVKKVLEIVPQMADRIICNLQFMNVYWAKHKEIKFFED